MFCIEYYIHTMHLLKAFSKLMVFLTSVLVQISSRQLLTNHEIYEKNKIITILFLNEHIGNTFIVNKPNEKNKFEGQFLEDNHYI